LSSLKVIKGNTGSNGLMLGAQ